MTRTRTTEHFTLPEGNESIRKAPNTNRELELIGKVNELSRELQDRIADHEEDNQALKECVARLKELDAWP